MKTLTLNPKAPLNMIVFSFDGISFPILDKLVNEGNNLVIAHVQSKKDLGEEDNEEPETKRRRLSLYDGILDKRPALDVIKEMKGIEDKSKWIVLFDFNSMGVLAEKCLEMGFTKGLFPIVKDTELEKDRDAAKEIVKKFYPDLTIAEVHEFKNIQEGIKFLEGNEKLWVLKGNSDDAKTVVTRDIEPELAHQTLIDAMESHKKDYEKEGFILEEKIQEAFEITPQIVFLDGKVVFTDIDIENKNIGSGNLSVQTGAMQSLVIKSNLDDEINRIAFPEWVYTQAKAHKGLFICDAGILSKDNKYYFTEFCFNRFGWDSVFAEIAMAGSSTEFFKNIFEGKDPLKKTFGVSIRALNMHKGDKDRRVLEGVTMIIGDEKNTFVYERKKEEEKDVTTGGYWDMAVFAGAGETVNKAAEEAYKAIEEFAFEDIYYRPLFDFMSCDYQNSIPNRFTNTNHQLFEAPDIVESGGDDSSESNDVEDALIQHEERISRLETLLDLASPK